MTYAYDTSDRLQTVTTDSRVSSYTWDSRGRLLTFRDPDNHLTQVEYQSTGAQNTFRVTSPDGTSVRYGYDAVGRPTTVTATDNTVHTTAYDALNRATQSTDPLNLTTQFTYAGNTGDVTSVLDAKGQTHQFRYNPMGWVYEEVSPGNRVRSAEFDREGNVTKQTDPAGRVVTATYGVVGRMASRTVDGVTTTFGYDPNRRWMRASSSVSTDTLFFDGSSRPIRSSVTRGTARFQILHTYDAQGRRERTGITGPWGDTLSTVFSYDAAGRLHGIRDLLTGAEAAQAVSGGSFSANTTRFTYNSEGLVGSIGLPSSGAFSFGYTPRHQVSSISIHHGLGGLDRSYDYTTRGQILRTSSPGVDRIREFGYDGSGQLTQASDYATGEEEVCPNPFDLTACYMEPYKTLLSTTTHAWDAVGNPTDRGAVVQTGNRLTSYDGWTLQYDAAGYLVSRSKSGVPTQTLAWNGLGQLTSVTTSGAGTVSFQYDGFGRRVRRTSPSGVVSQYLYDGHDLVMEMDGAGNRRRAYSHYAGIDQPHSVREFTGSAAGTYYFAMELPGHVSGLTNASGQLVNRYQYSPFGKLEYVQEGVPNPLRYMAREWDPDAGLYYVRNRWYDPQVGRFISEDPIGIDGGINVYAYAMDDPINGRDPLGLCVVFGSATLQEHANVKNGKDVYCTIKLAGVMIEGNASGSRGWFLTPRSYPIQDYRPNEPGGEVGLGADPRATDREQPNRSCGQLWASAGLSLGLDILTLYPGYAAWRAWQASGNILAQKAAGSLSASVLENTGRVDAARAAFRGTAASGGAGVGLNGLQTASDGANWRYAVPIWGTGERLGDAMICQWVN